MLLVFVHGRKELASTVSITITNLVSENELHQKEHVEKKKKMEILC